MKKLLILFLISYIGNSQEFKYDENGFINKEVVRTVNLSAEETQEKVSEWIEYYYKNPDFVKKGSVDSKFLRFSGMREYGNKKIGMGVVVPFNLYYTLRVDFKNEKYRLVVEQADYVPEGTAVISKQKVKGGKKLKQAYEEYYTDVINDINSIEISLYNYVSGKENLTSDNW
ncbi:hypothetical protein [Joostella sp. CR20]|uniref:hypothetical protein n=1 Tax=Joostella sp. CR20 TaxID=2804312 RepID=UPI00313C467A